MHGPSPRYIVDATNPFVQSDENETSAWNNLSEAVSNVYDRCESALPSPL